MAGVGPHAWKGSRGRGIGPSPEADPGRGCPWGECLVPVHNANGWQHFWGLGEGGGGRGVGWGGGGGISKIGCHS